MAENNEGTELRLTDEETGEVKTFTPDEGGAFTLPAGVYLLDGPVSFPAAAENR